MDPLRSPDWPGIHCVANAGLKFMVSLRPQLPGFRVCSTTGSWSITLVCVVLWEGLACPAVSQQWPSTSVLAMEPGSLISADLLWTPCQPASWELLVSSLCLHLPCSYDCMCVSMFYIDSRGQTQVLRHVRLNLYAGWVISMDLTWPFAFSLPPFQSHVPSPDLQTWNILEDKVESFWK